MGFAIATVTNAALAWCGQELIPASQVFLAVTHNGIPNAAVKYTEGANAAVGNIGLPTAAVTDAGLAHPAVSWTLSHSLNKKSLLSRSMESRSLAVTFIAHARYRHSTRTRTRGFRYCTCTLPSRLANAAITNAAHERRRLDFRLALATVTAQERHWSRSPNSLSPPSRSPGLHTLLSRLAHVAVTNAVYLVHERSRHDYQTRTRCSLRTLHTPCFHKHLHARYYRLVRCRYTLVSRSLYSHTRCNLDHCASTRGRQVLQSPQLRTLHAVANTPFRSLHPLPWQAWIRVHNCLVHRSRKRRGREH